MRKRLFWERRKGPWLCLSNVCVCVCVKWACECVCVRLFHRRDRWPSDSLLCDVMSLPPFVSSLKRTFLKMSFCLKVLNSPPSSFAWQRCVCVCVSACVCTLAILDIVLPPQKNRNCWDADEDAEGCVFPCLVCTYIQSRILFHNTLWMWWGANGGDLHVTTHFI